MQTWKSDHSDVTPIVYLMNILDTFMSLLAVDGEREAYGALFRSRFDGAEIPFCEESARELALAEIAPLLYDSAVDGDRARREGFDFLFDAEPADYYPGRYMRGTPLDAYVCQMLDLPYRSAFPMILIAC